MGFTPATGSPFAAGTSATSVAIADLNGDARPDLATANSSSGSVTVLLGNGSGGFTPAPGSPFAAGSGPFSVAIADLNGDGKPDLATANSGTANSGSGNVTVLLNASTAARGLSADPPDQWGQPDRRAHQEPTAPMEPPGPSARPGPLDRSAREPQGRVGRPDRRAYRAPRARAVPPDGPPR